MYLIEIPEETQFLLPSQQLLKESHIPCDPWARENCPSDTSNNQYGLEGTSPNLGQHLLPDHLRDHTCCLAVCEECPSQTSPGHHRHFCRRHAYTCTAENVDARDSPVDAGGCGVPKATPKANSIPWKAPPCARPRGLPRGEYAETSALFVPPALNALQGEDRQVPPCVTRSRDSLYYSCQYQCVFAECENWCSEQDPAHRHHVCTQHIP